MKTPIQIRLSLAPLTFRDRENVKLDFQTRSRLGCAVMPKAFGILLNKDGHCQGYRTAKLERRRCAQVLMRRAEAARIRAASARRRESSPRERDQQRVLFQAVNGSLDGCAIRTISIYRERIDRTQKK